MMLSNILVPSTTSNNFSFSGDDYDHIVVGEVGYPSPSSIRTDLWPIIESDEEEHMEEENEYPKEDEEDKMKYQIRKGKDQEVGTSSGKKRRKVQKMLLLKKWVQRLSLVGNYQKPDGNKLKIPTTTTTTKNSGKKRQSQRHRTHTEDTCALSMTSTSRDTLCDQHHHQEEEEEHVPIYRRRVNSIDTLPQDQEVSFESLSSSSSTSSMCYSNSNHSSSSSQYYPTSIVAGDEERTFSGIVMSSNQRIKSAISDPDAFLFSSTSKGCKSRKMNHNTTPIPSSPSMFDPKLVDPIDAYHISSSSSSSSSSSAFNCFSRLEMTEEFKLNMHLRPNKTN